MKKLQLCILGSLFAASLQAQSTDYTKGLSIWFDTPNNLDGRASWYSPATDKAWENNSLPIGNGSLGGNVMGSIAAERITLNEKTLWRGGPNTEKGAAYYWNVNKESAHLLPEIRQAFTDGNQKKAEELTCKNFNGLADYEPSRETPFRFGSFTTLGEAYIETGLSEIGMTNYKRILSLDSAMAVVSFRKDEVNYERKYFVSYPDSVMVLKFTADRPGMQNLIFSYGSNPEAIGDIKADGPNRLLYTGCLKNNQMKFALRIQAINKGGSLNTTDGKFIVRNADEVIFLLTADTDYKLNFNPDFKDPKTYVGPDPEQTTLAMMDAAAAKSYNELCERHKTDYTQLFGRVQLQLNPRAPMTLQYPAVTDLPTYQRLARYRKGNPDYRLEEIYYQFGRILINCQFTPRQSPGQPARNVGQRGRWPMACRLP